MPLAGREVRCCLWRVTGFPIVPLYLLEPENPDDRWMTARLYGGGADDRVLQEMLLGIGGVRALQALGLTPDVYHFNEGHAVFAGLELLSAELERGRPFAEAWAEVRQKVVFTTHTPVEAGNEIHPIERLLRLGAHRLVSPERLVELGGDPFNMTVAGLRLARTANAVSRLHGETARRMWHWVSDAAPIGHVTNGVHLGTWQDPSLRWAHTPDRIWEAHRALKRSLLAEIQQSTGVQLQPEGLLVGFARRVAAYKRSDLLLRHAERIGPQLESGQLQLVFAGKAHPADGPGREILTEVIRLSHRYPQSVVFLPDYAMDLAQRLTRGCDVWLNNPRRPLEACGTSGMKAALNGVLNLSILDGWWAEACVHDVNGWGIGDGGQSPQGSDVEQQDEADLGALCHTLLTEVLPTFQRPTALGRDDATLDSDGELGLLGRADGPANISGRSIPRRASWLWRPSGDRASDLGRSGWATSR